MILKRKKRRPSTLKWDMVLVSKYMAKTNRALQWNTPESGTRTRRWVMLTASSQIVVSIKVILSRVSSRTTVNFGGRLTKMVPSTRTRASGQTVKWMAPANSNTSMAKSWKEPSSTTCCQLQKVARSISFVLLRPRLSIGRLFRRPSAPLLTRRKSPKKKVKPLHFTRLKISRSLKVYFWPSRKMGERLYSLVLPNQTSGLETFTTSSRTMARREISKPYIWEILLLRPMRSHTMKESSILKKSTSLAQTCYTEWSLARDQGRLFSILMRTVVAWKGRIRMS